MKYVMKKHFSFLIVCIFISIIGCGKNDNKISENQKETAKDNVSENNSSEVKTIEVKVPTVQCGTCKKNIETSLKKIDGINDAKVNVKNKNAMVMFDPSKTDLAKIEGVIALTGYQANDKPADQNAYNNLEECCKIGGHD